MLSFHTTVKTGHYAYPSWLANLMADVPTTTEHIDLSDGDGHNAHSRRDKDYSQ